MTVTKSESLSDATRTLVSFLRESSVDAELIQPGVPMPTVPLAARAIGVEDDQIIKSVLFKGKEGELVLAIASGTARIDRAALEAIAGTSKLKLADAETVLAATGFPAGGVAPVGHLTKVTVVVDRRVMGLPEIFGGGGAEDVLLRIRPQDIVALTAALSGDITAPPG
jgi:prolyl-tRNA editing enzyme YbaK/EbsC (Cys-tRNA(Pro) deacylase)